MLITNLAGPQYDNQIDVALVEKCLSASCHSFTHRRLIGDHSKNSGVLPFCKDFSYYYYYLGLLKEIPIFLVTKQERQKKFTIGYFGHKDDVTVPPDEMLRVLPNDVDSILDEVNHMEENEQADKPGNDIARISSIDLWGIYTREYPQSGAYGIEDSHPRIFIWVDKILEYVNEDRHKFQVLSAQVILHELAHAMMDINIAGVYRSSFNRAAFSPSFYSLKEESLANAISLSLLESHIDTADMDFIKNVIKQQPFEYALGLDYYEGVKPSIPYSVRNWIHLKESMNYSQAVVREWVKYVYGPKPLEGAQLMLLDSNMYSTEFLFRYPANTGRFYDVDELCLLVIKDYVATHPTITRTELHSVFPSNINEYYEPIIDYPEQQEFNNKLRSFIRSADKKNIVHCADGKIVICDYWHSNSMDAFIANASRLGIEIDRF